MLPSYTIAAENETYPTKLINGDFEAPALVYDDFTSDNSISGPWYVQNVDTLNSMARDRNSEFGWRTTAYNGKIELVSGVKGNIHDNYGINPNQGQQMAELCAEEQSSIYQNISTVPGAVFDWNIAHAGRRSSNETMALFIGAKPDYSLTKPNGGIGNGANDIFMWMAELLKSTNHFDLESNATGAECLGPFTVYAKGEAGLDLSTVNSSNYTDYVSPTKTDTINKEWKCWIIKDEQGKWGLHHDKYYVPANQTVSTFAFTALNGRNYYGNQINEGNLLDGIVFEHSFPLMVSTTWGGLGSISSNLSSAEADIIYGEPIVRNVPDETLITITANAEGNDKFTFDGAFVNNIMHRKDETDFWVYNDNTKTYTHTFPMTESYNIKLVYSKESTVVFGPNGGTYNNSKQPTVISMSRDHTQCDDNGAIISPEEETKRSKFIGWIASASLKDGYPARTLIDKGIDIHYLSGDGDTNDKYSIRYKYVKDNEYTELTKPVTGAGLTFTAQYAYINGAVARTKERTDSEYTNKSIGGSVHMTVRHMVEDSGYHGEIYETKGVNDQVKNTYAYLRPADEIEFTAAANEGYTFMGWYDEAGNLVAKGTTYAYSAEHRSRILRARFCAVLAFPYLSFIPQEKNPNSSDELFKEGHLKIAEHDLRYVQNNELGGEIYGNTISTAFSAAQYINGLVYNSCIWNIAIPATTNGGNPIYVKTNNPSSISGQPILSDKGNVRHGGGTIYKLKNALSQDYTISFTDNLPTVSGDGAIQFGIVLDNIYAPGATATIELYHSSDAQKPSGTDIREETHASTLDEFKQGYYGEVIE